MFAPLISFLRLFVIFQREAFKGILKKTAIEGKEIDYVIAGTVIQEVLTSNIAREAGMGAGLPLSCPGHTVTLACISSNVAAMTATAMIKSGMIETALIGGVEYMSDVPIKFQRPLRKRMIKATKMKSAGQYLSLLNGLKFADLAPQAPAVAEFSTGEVMGYSADKLASKFGVTRAEQDEFALRSHQLAAKAQAAGLFDDEIIPTKNSRGAYVLKDNGVRGDSTLEKLASLKPAFIKPHGTITAANASFLTDGASAAILMSEEKCLAMGYVPRSIIAHTVFTSQDPKEELLLGPAYAISKACALPLRPPRRALSLAVCDSLAPPSRATRRRRAPSPPLRRALRRDRTSRALCAPPGLPSCLHPSQRAPCEPRPTETPTPLACRTTSSAITGALTRIRHRLRPRGGGTGGRSWPRRGCRSRTRTKARTRSTIKF